MFVKLKDLGLHPRPDMLDVLEDAECPTCRNLLKVGEYVCWGKCFNCLEEDFENFYLESEK